MWPYFGAFSITYEAPYYSWLARKLLGMESKVMYIDGFASVV